MGSNNYLTSKTRIWKPCYLNHCLNIFSKPVKIGEINPIGVIEVIHFSQMPLLFTGMEKRLKPAPVLVLILVLFQKQYNRYIPVS